jgi:two-component system, LytTR family, response regulator
MIKAVIIDDEKHAVDAISILLDSFKDEIALVGVSYSVGNGIDVIRNLKPDLVFLDIELKDGIGFEVAEKTADVGYKLIFTTAYDQYAIKAFKVRAMDYLLKPLDIAEFQKTVRHCIQEIQNKDITTTKEQHQYDELIKVPEADGYQLIAVQDVIYLQADSNYTRIVTKSKKAYIVAKTLKEFESKLDPGSFARIHHSYIVNRSEIKQLLKGNNSQIRMSDDTCIPVSRAKKKLLF